MLRRCTRHPLAVRCDLSQRKAGLIRLDFLLPISNYHPLTFAVKFKFAYLVPLLLICLIGAIFWGLSNGDGAEPNDEDEAPVTPGAEGTKLGIGEDYYLCPVLIEAAPGRLAKSWFEDKLESKAWDINGTAPDIQCNLTWNGNVVYTSSPKADSLIATWSPVGTDVANLISTGNMPAVRVLRRRWLSETACRVGRRILTAIILTAALPKGRI